MSAPVALVFSYQYPGKYAFNVLAGAVGATEALADVPVHFPRDREGVLARVREELAAGRTVVAAWSFYSPSFPPAVEELAWVRERLPPHAPGRLLCIAGGVHATAEPEEVLRAGFDAVGVGEGERILTGLLLALRAGAPWRHGAIQGLAHLSPEGRVVSAGRSEGLVLDEWPPFAHAFRRYGAIELTRGCVYACRFCQTPYMNKARFRHRSPDNVAHWVRVLRGTGRRDVRFITPTSFSYGARGGEVDLAAIEELLAKVREAAGPDGRVYYGTFPSEIRPEHVTPEGLALLKRYADNDNVIIGGQSGSDAVLAASKRGHDAEAIVRATRIAVECGFVPNVDFILGLPTETEADVEATVALMHRLAELGARVHGHTFMPLPGTPFRYADPGKVSPEVVRRLDRLASTGRLYGHWKAQAKLAETMKRERPHR